MAAYAVEEFKFKIAKAKDLPPTWYELVLRPNKFQDHVNTLHTNTHLEPSALALIATFLEKAGCLEGQSPLPEGVTISKDRRDVLVNCALFMGAFLNWDLRLFTHGLPSAVVYSLLTSLVTLLPLSLPVSSNPSDTILSHILYNLWIVQFSTQCYLLAKPPQTLLWEGTCASVDAIKQLVFPKVDEAVSFLMEACDLRINFALPFTYIELAKSLTKTDILTIKLPLKPASIPWKDLHTQIYFDVGQVYFEQEDYQKALSCFQKCSSMLQDISGITSPYPYIDTEQLKGFMLACSTFDLEDDNLDGSSSLEDSDFVFEMCRQRKSYQDNEDQFSYCLSHTINLPAAYKAGFALDISDWSELVAMEPSTSKRSRRELGSGLYEPFEQFSLWDIIGSVSKGTGVPPTALNVLFASSLEDDNTVASFTKVLSEVLETSNDEVSKKRLSLLLKSVHTNNAIWKENTGQYPNELLAEDSCHDLSACGSSTYLKSPDPTSPSQDPVTRVMSVMLSRTPDEVMDSVKNLFQQTPKAEHVAVATMFKGEGQEYINHEGVKNLLLCTQYNTLIQKATGYLHEKNYGAADEFYLTAAQLLSTNKFFPNQVRLGLVPVLMEHSLRLRMIAAAKTLRSISNKQACEKYSSLLEEAKIHYRNNTNPNSNPLVITLSGVFLLNLQQYSFIIHCDNLTFHERICPRLAISAQCVKENKDLRKCTRELFEIVASVFVLQNRGKIDDNQHLLRQCLEVIINNLQDLVSLSYLIAALARLWNLVKKPEFEITSEYTNHWPTAVGNSSNIDPDHVLRSLQMLLSNSLQILPSYSSWLVIQGDVFLATADYISALRCYLEAGAQESDFFESEVPDSVWNKQVYHRLIECCLKLNYYSQSLILCQFLTPPNYSYTFSLLKEHVRHILVSVFDYLWDMCIIEFLIYTLAKESDTVKQSAAIQVAGKPELNTSNQRDILLQAISVRKRTFLKSLFQTVITSPNET